VRVLVLEAGVIGRGDERTDAVLSSEAHLNAADEQQRYAPFRSGTAVMLRTSTIKMICSLYPSSSRDFVHHHGREGAARYLRLAQRGIELEKRLAKRLLPDATTQLRELGALYVAHENEREELREEYQLLRELGMSDAKWLDTPEVRRCTYVVAHSRSHTLTRTHAQVVAAHGSAANFTCGIYLPNDAIIDSSEYARSLLRAAAATQLVTVREQCPRVVRVETLSQADGTPRGARTHLADGSVIDSEHVVVASGGHFADPALWGIFNPCWSYLVSIPDPRRHATDHGGSGGMALPHSPNFYTWGFTHDWSNVDGHVRISGEDHFSALKPPRATERCLSLALWGLRKYPYLADGRLDELLSSRTAAKQWLSTIEHYYAVYSETPDSLPLVGRASARSRVCYVLGCNAWGQASLSYCAALVPGLLGYEELSSEQAELYQLVSISRFVGQPALGLYQSTATTSSSSSSRARL